MGHGLDGFFFGFERILSERKVHETVALVHFIQKKMSGLHPSTTVF